MKRLAKFFIVSALVLLFGCGGAPPPAPVVSLSPTPTSPGTPALPNLDGNWQFSAASSVPGNPSLIFAGSVRQAGPAVTAALHVNGSNCFNQLKTLGLTASVTAGDASNTTSLTSTALDGQIVTFTGNLTGSTFTGTYSISGGCADGDQGSVTGIAISIADADAWGGTFTSSAQQTFHVTGDFHQRDATSPDGSSQITGTAAFDTPCFKAVALNAGSFPSGSFILGSLVSLEMKTDNGTINFVGTVDPGTELLSGSYNVSGGDCDQTGTAKVALTGQWDY